MFGLGGSEIAIICFVLLLLFGAKRVPEMMKGIGETIKELRGVQNESK